MCTAKPITATMKCVVVEDRMLFRAVRGKEEEEGKEGDGGKKKMKKRRRRKEKKE